jgi:cytoskeletal protein CcmA (bactofilin family)
MAVSLDTKVDLLLKKLSGLSKTDTGTNKSTSNESIPSPSLNRADTQWLNAYLIPFTASSTLGTVDSYFQNNRVQCTPDTTSQRVNNVYPTWKTSLIDWIPPEFDPVNVINSYRVKVFYGNAGLTDPEASGGTQIFADGSLGQGEWFFDYQSGVLNFFGNTPIPAGMTSTHVIYVLGYRYVGPRGFNSVFQVDTPTMRGNPLLPTLITLKGDFVVEKNLTVKEDLEIQGGDLTTNQTTFNLLNTTATTVNFAGAGTTVNIGAATGTTRVKNDLDVDGDVNIDGGDLKTTATAFNLLPDTATTVNFAGAATDLVVGATTGTTRIRNNLDVDGDFNVDGDFHIGKNLDVDGDLNIDGGDLTVSTSTFNIANANATTINFGGSATNIEIGASTGTTNVNNNLDIDGDVNIDGGDLTVSTSVFNLANETATTVNFAGDATNVQIGSDQGDTNVNNNLTVDGVTNVQKELTVEGDTTVNSKLTVEGIVDVNNSLYVTGSTDVSESLKVQGSTSVQKELVVEGNTQMNKGLSVEGELKAGKLVDTVIDCGEY